MSGQVSGLSSSDLLFIQRHVHRNPYTGASSLDVDALLAEPRLLELLSRAWEAGYGAGFDDGICDSSVESQTRNPYKIPGQR
jgi:hypothetical protein